MVFGQIVGGWWGISYWLNHISRQLGPPWPQRDTVANKGGDVQYGTCFIDFRRLCYGVWCVYCDYGVVGLSARWSSGQRLLPENNHPHASTALNTHKHQLANTTLGISLCYIYMFLFFLDGHKTIALYFGTSDVVELADNNLRFVKSQVRTITPEDFRFSANSIFVLLAYY